MSSREDLPARILNSLAEQIAVIDHRGEIVYINNAWSDFGRDNGLPENGAGCGTNYLQVLQQAADSGDRLATTAARGIGQVIEGNLPAFYHEYPCHSPEKKRWFMMRVCPVIDSKRQLAVISHQDITARKLAEQKADYLSRHDFLTELANRRYFHHHLSEEIRRCTRQKAPISLIELDVDRFKTYNDSLGHPAGDSCLKQIAEVIKNLCNRAGDLAARLGGDEFALILPNTPAEGARQIAMSIRAGVKALDLRHVNGRNVTVSMGIVSETPDLNTREESLLEQADRALYREKARIYKREQG